MSVVILKKEYAQLSKSNQLDLILIETMKCNHNQYYHSIEIERLYETIFDKIEYPDEYLMVQQWVHKLCTSKQDKNLRNMMADLLLSKLINRL